MKIPEFKYGDLENKEKADLEKIKLSLEIDQIQNSSKEKWEARRFRQETFRIIVILGLAILGNYFVSDNLSKENSTDNISKIIYEKYLDYTREYANSDGEKKDQIACLIVDVLNHSDTVNVFLAHILRRTGDVYIFPCEIYKENENIVYNSGRVGSTLVDSIKSKEKEINNLNQGIINKTYNKAINMRIKKLENDFELIIQQSSDLASLSQSSETIEKFIIKVLGDENWNLKTFSNESFSTTKKISDVCWIKEGFFLQFQNNLQIKLDKDGLSKDDGYIKVEVCDTNINECIYDLEVFLSGQGGEIKFGDKKYKINLRVIDRAGKNPFNWAA